MHFIYDCTLLNIYFTVLRNKSSNNNYNIQIIILFNSNNVYFYKYYFDIDQRFIILSLKFH